VVIAEQQIKNVSDSDFNQGVGAVSDPEVQAIWDLLEEVKDPEIPVLSILELGVLRNVALLNNKAIITITPTYSGCPAMDAISTDIRSSLAKSGYLDIQVLTVLSPAWTTDWMSEEGKEKLVKFGIAAPALTETGSQAVCCPRCKSESTHLISEYGSTACKAMYQCDLCQEAFCYFKAI
jgi:ring-1,2-phenylacetyl-CoA epoxidase subunit PaaD